MYGVAPYFLTKNLIDMPVLFLQPLLMLLIVFWGIGFNNSWETFCGFYFAMMFVGQCAAGLGLMVSSAVDNPHSAVIIGNVFMVPCILFGGYFANDSSMLKGFNLAQYLSPIRYGFQNFAISQWQPQGEQEIYKLYLGFDTLDYWTCTVLLIILMLLLRLISIVALRMNIKKFN